MKKIFVLFLGCLLLGCQEDNDDVVLADELEGTWLLTEVLFDPGDGSGEFAPSDAGFEITLRQDNTFEANFHVCRVFEEGNRQTGTFTRIGVTEILITCGDSFSRGIQGRLENGQLVFYYPCIEPCVYRFERVSGVRE
ncbi:hypothetical protein [Robiginitalea sp. SC105]|uniref:hypothetical protein n=1 Tax=Robiginitalea sp. SC105 TaxID=2762332 RepID=UPI00163ADBDC|nr:hypothetical protein [Robiginitalea sp. SC105]MBC2839579.1 hypothetical protein [Robiginitalea sp. SC105]